MSIWARTAITATVFLTALLILHSVTYGQEATPLPASPSSQSPADKQKSEAEATTPTSDGATPTPIPEPDFWNREELTGEWGGTRSRWKAKGFGTEFKLT